MARGDPPVTGNPVDPSGTFSIEARPAGDPDNTLTVTVSDNKRLEIFIDPGDSPPLTLLVHKQNWSMEIREVD